ncbi:hypothetical protein EVAR_48634_1 [Eumeta japonica]|uniref:Uncharacterized protein n=1 Tax=Eumeta variegata TaxID=151549 RepID=A0A4C1XSJ5_EUMVA|nr:hypothetical protein EVAR_48634_1 [Eumeta japonica]
MRTTAEIFPCGIRRDPRAGVGGGAHFPPYAVSCAFSGNYRLPFTRGEHARFLARLLFSLNFYSYYKKTRLLVLRIYLDHFPSDVCMFVPVCARAQLWQQGLPPVTPSSRGERNEDWESQFRYSECMWRANENAAVLTSSYQKDYLSVYAPDMSILLEERKEFWTDVRDILMKCERNERILSDFNGWMGVQWDEHEKVLVKRMKVGNAAGYDRVSSEMLRSGGGYKGKPAVSALTNKGKAIGCLMTGVKQTLYPSIKGKALGRRWAGGRAAASSFWRSGSRQFVSSNLDFVAVLSPVIRPRGGGTAEHR